MNKRYIQLILFVCLLCVSGQVVAQDSLRDRIARKKAEKEGTQEKKNTDLSVRAQLRSETNATNVENASWVRIIYRYLDLKEDKNAALYNPINPINNRTNLYTLIFKLMAEDKINAYDFNNSQDVFTEQNRVTPEDMFKRLNIPYSVEGNTITYETYNIPSADVLGYYIKEVHYFDKTNSELDVKVEAICPIIFRNDVDGYIIQSMENGIREPQFWIPYSEIKPYLSRMPIMTSNLNNVLDKTINDFFVLRLYDGEIYKAMNMQDKLLVELYKTEEEQNQAREKIEQELTDFNKNLWVINDSVKVSDGEEIRREKKKKPDGKNSSGAKNSARDRRLKF